MKAAKEKVDRIFREKAEKEADRIPFQGDMISLMAKEKQDISWQSVIYRVPRGVMAWAVRAGTQSLATTDNLARWGVKVDIKCQMEGCAAPATLGHILNNCDKCHTSMRACTYAWCCTKRTACVQSCMRVGVQAGMCVHLEPAINRQHGYRRGDS